MRGRVCTDASVSSGPWPRRATLAAVVMSINNFTPRSRACPEGVRGVTRVIRGWVSGRVGQEGGSHCLTSILEGVLRGERGCYKALGG